ncbi:stabilin-1 isoform X3 [Sphaerodactylus townsendi]|uniref:stabilin-1 isoform X3 n=1 Tax=Sphaerodactylus townsendi TaxID=933632 RepID=UPI00202748D3|nr:stabilin-1 isoform X3 [Sphaerodactylus townsendi]
MKMKPHVLFFFLPAICLIYTAKGQKNKLKSMQCNRKLTFTQNTPCTSCAVANRLACPLGWIKTSSLAEKGCRYTVQLEEITLSLSGCSHTCKKDIEENLCCPGYWGSECYECPAGFGKPCSGHGTCLDGITGNGSCICKDNYGGYACQDCWDDTHFGSDCQSVCECQHGICNHGISGDGGCTCYGGYTGPRCDQDPLCRSVFCGDKSHCVVKDGQASCECSPGYKKFGTSCQVQDPCRSSPCSSFAVCKTLGAAKYECTCQYGYQGDGRICQPINPCVNNNGDCPENSTYCKFLSPGKSICVCKPGMTGVNPAMGCTSNSGCRLYRCEKNAKCETGPDGTARCVCSEDEIGDGRACYKAIIHDIAELNMRGRTRQRLTSAKSMFDLGCALLLGKYGPFTVLVPSSPGFPDRSQHFDATSAHHLCRMHIIPGQHLLEDMMKAKVLWTLSGHQVIFSDQLRKSYSYSDNPKELYTITDYNYPASNGIIHIVSALKKTPSMENLGNSQKTIGEILASLEIASRFETILENCGLPSFLDGPGPFTVFVPSNEAVDKLRDGRLIYLFTKGINKLQELVKYHIYTAAVVTVERLTVMPNIMTMANQILTVNITEDGRFLLGDSGVAINKRNILASNGIIHTLDGILIPQSIIPILPHKCNEQLYKAVAGSCVDCDALNTSVCPPQSTPMEHGIFPGECIYIHNPLSLNVLKKGCIRYCNQTLTIPGCCKGFFGPDCAACPGGFTNPCYGKGICADGIRGNGQCRCFEGFKGIACHICSDPNKHGENCDKECGCVHGICDNRPGSRGVCQPGSCKAGYTGEFCNRSSHNCGLAGASLNCHQNAVCSLNDTARCICLDGYEGDGFSCTPIDVCRNPEHGVCSENAICTNTGPGTAKCQCNNGWTGDGKACVAINNCVMENRGGCHTNADCHYIGPGQNSCECKRGYNGDGFNCNFIDPCLVNNGGCHDFAVCESLGAGDVDCSCPEGYMGNGDICYADIMTELARNYHFSMFFDWIKESLFSIPEGANVTVLVPVNTVIEKLNNTEKDLWLNPDVLPVVVRAHFLQGSFMTGQLKKYVGQELPTLNPQVRWKINIHNGTLVIQNARVVAGDIPAINSTIYIIDQVLLPLLADRPPQHPGLQQQLNMTLSFSRFQKLLEHYQLIGEIESSEKYTIFVPGNSSVEKYCQEFNITQLDKDTVKYHVILGEKLFPMDLKNGIHKSTMLGLSYWLMFYKNTTQAFVNKILLDGQFFETRNGMLIGVSEILPVQKNRCTTNTTTVQKSRCAKCNKKFKCPRGSVLYESMPENLPHCEYKSGKDRLVGCHFTCMKVSLVSVCCEGYFGQMCEMCPGKPGNWCSGNGICQDGISGSGECQCHEGFYGTACEMCQPGRYGASCKAECNCKNGTCNDGLLGDGSCLCNPGWKGINCDKKIETDLCNGTCDENANCLNGSTASWPSCICSAGYTGNGIYCTEIDPCALGNGGCSVHAICTKVAAGQRICSCKEGYAGDGIICREIDLCLENQGGCHPYAECVKTGPGQVACNCLPNYSGDGVKECKFIDPCSKSKEDCSQQGYCFKNSIKNEICICVMGTGGVSSCTQTSWKEESVAREAVSQFFQYAKAYNIIDLSKDGHYTFFVPLVDFQWDNTTLLEWKKGSIKDFLLYHVVICQRLLSNDLELLDSITTLSGHKIQVSTKEDSIYLNKEVKIIDSDFEGPKAVIHFIDKILIPNDMQNHDVSSNLSEKSITEVAEAYGYKIYSKLLEEAGLLPLINEPTHQPFTMFWPTDAAFNSLPEDRKNWLYHKEHRSKLAAYLKQLMIRSVQVFPSILIQHKLHLTTMHGSTISFSCSKNSPGYIQTDNTKIIHSYMEFNVGIAYGIDQLLEPPDQGARCDEFHPAVIADSECGSCIYPLPCPFRSVEQGPIMSCLYNGHVPLSKPVPHDIVERRPYFPQFQLRRNLWNLFTRKKGCKRKCVTPRWTSKCCKDHYGRNCQACPGGLEALCSNRGDCDDGFYGSGQCICKETFTGTACELCMPGRYGLDCKECNCTENGICNEGLHGDGFCFCASGWTGERCEIPLAATPKCSPACHRNAVCRFNNTCECNLHYEGDGRICTVIDQCGDDNGGCSDYANCTQIGTVVSCACLPNYQGDGFFCSPVDRCADGSNGDCSEHATCISTGPNTRRCECKAGYVGNGVQCLEEAIPPIDRCLDENGHCHFEAICTDLHFHDKTAGIFHLQSPNGKYNFTYREAEARCAAEEATLATLQQLSAAQQMGFHLCIVGWLFNRSAGYPTVYPSAKCGTNHVGIVNYGFRSDSNETWDAYCYRPKDVRCDCRDGFIGDGYTCIGSLLTVLEQKANFSVYYFMLLDYANATQEGLEFLDLLSDDTTYKTLFVPLNSGFRDNTSLTLNDLKLHVSVGDEPLLSVNLTSGTIISSQAGYSLSIADSVNNTHSLGSKTVNNTMIVEWDILASNGIIHAIETPLMVPLQHGHVVQVLGDVKASASAATIGMSTIAIGLLCAAIAGISYYCLRRKNQGFQFRYLKAELEDEEPLPWEERSPALVSIPNPIYGTHSSLYDEPFEDSANGEDFSDTHGIFADQ